MALTAQQLNDSVFLTNMISNLKKQRESGLRDVNKRKMQDIRLLEDKAKRDGINSGYEESNFARLLARAAQNAANIYAQFDPQIAEIQGYLDAWNQRQAEAAAAAAARRRAQTVEEQPLTYDTPTRQAGYTVSYEDRRLPYANSPSYLARYNRNVNMVK